MITAVAFVVDRKEEGDFAARARSDFKSEGLPRVVRTARARPLRVARPPLRSAVRVSADLHSGLNECVGRVGEIGRGGEDAAIGGEANLCAR